MIFFLAFLIGLVTGVLITRIGRWPEPSTALEAERQRWDGWGRLITPS